jgi:hypothetical protein
MYPFPRKPRRLTSGRRAKFARQVAAIEALEPRSLLTVIPQGVTLAPTPVENTPIAGETVATFISPADTNPADFSALIHWGDGGTSAGTIQPVGPVALPGPGAFLFQVLGDHTYGDETNGANLQVQVDITDKNDATTSSAFSSTTIADSALTGTGPVSISGTEGSALTGITLATFSHVDGNHTASSYQVAVTWGDGTAVDTSATLTITPGGPGVADKVAVSGNHTYTQKGTYNLSVALKDLGGSSATVTTQALIADAAPLTSNVSYTIQATVGVPLTNVLVAGFTDPNPQATAADFAASVSFGGVIEPGTVHELSPGTFSVTASHTFGAPGTAIPVTTTVTDIAGTGTNQTLTNTGAVTANVAAAALAPSASPVVVPEGTSIPAGVAIGTFTDLGGAQAVANYAPSFVHFQGATANTPLTVTQNGSTNTYTLATAAATTFTAGNIDEGISAYTLTVADVGGRSATTTGALTVTDAPLAVAVNPGTLPVTEGLSTNVLPVLTFTDANPAAKTTDFTATIDWGDGTADSVGTITATLPPGTFAVDGMHSYALGRVTPYPITVTVHDIGGQQLTAQAAALVSDASLSVGQSVPLSAGTDQPLLNVPLATFGDANLLAMPTSFNATIKWGDGSPDTQGFVTVIGGSPGIADLNVSGSHSYGKAGSFPITITVIDESGGAITLSTTATVSANALVASVPPLTATEGTPTPASLVVASFTSGTGSEPIGNFSATVNWGDGTPIDNAGSGVTIVANGGGSYSVQAPTHTYVEEGSYVVTVTITDSNGPATTAAGGLAVVHDAALAGTNGGTTNATEGTPVAISPLVTFTDANPKAPLGDFTATIYWGDGTTGVGAISQSGGLGTPFAVAGTHTYLKPGTYTVNVAVQDAGGSATTATATVVVADAALTAGPGIPVSAATGQALVNVPLATFSDANPLATPSSFNATINWGDASPTTQGFVTLVGGTATSSIFSVSGSHVYTKSGSFTITITVNDSGGNSTTLVTTATVSSNALVANVVPISATEGLATPPGQVIATFTSDSGSEPLSNFSATINWGDGTPIDNGASGVTIVANGGGSYSVQAPTHTFAEEGTYVVTVTITDSNGPTTTSGGNLATVKDAALTGTNGGSTNATEGTSITISPLVTFTDANPKGTLSDFTATIAWGDGTSSTGTITQPGGVGTPFAVAGTHTYVSEGTYPVSVAIVDVGGSTTSATATVVVAEAPITVNPTPLSITGYENTPLINVDVATFTSSNPSELASDFVASINWGDGTSTAATIVKDAGTPSLFHVQGNHTYTASGKFFAAITIAEADNPGTILGSTTANVTMGFTPLVVTSVPVNGTEGIALPNAQNTTNGTVLATFIDTAGADPIASYTASINWGNGLTTPGTVLVSGSNFSVVAPAAPAVTYAEAGTYTVQVSVTDTDAGGSFTAVGSATATVRDAKLTADPTQPIVTATQQTPLAAVQVSKFTDANLTAPLSDFTATIDWGDGSPQSAGQLVQPGGAGTAFFVTGNHTYALPTTAPSPPDTVTVTIHDVDGNTLVTTTIANVAPSTVTGTAVTVQATEGQPLSNVVVATFTDSGIPGPIGDYSATINWGTGLPGATTTGTIVAQGGNGFLVEGSFTYPEEDVTPGTPYPITVTIDHNGAIAATVDSKAQVADAPISGVAIPVFPTEGAPFTGTVAIFTDSDPAGTATDYTATISWGNGDTTAGTIVVNGSSFLVTAADPVSGKGYAYPSGGTYTFHVTVKDVGGATFTAYQTATVADAALTATGLTLGIAPSPIVFEYPAFSGEVATFTDADPNGHLSLYTATINWGDGSVTTGTISLSSTTAGVFIVSGTHSFEEGVHPIIITVKDVDGAQADANTTLTVTDSPLAGGAATAITAVEGQAFTAQVGTFTDANLVSSASEFTATITWGDGATASGAIAKQADGTYTVSGSHTYAEESAPGSPFAIAVSIKDNDGTATAADTATAAVGDAHLTATSGAILSTLEGMPLPAGPFGTGPLVATLQDANPGATLSDFTSDKGAITIDFGDGSAPFVVPASNIVAIGSPAGVTFEIFAGAHVYKEEGVYKTTVTINDTGGAAAIAHSATWVGDSALAPSAAQPVVDAPEGTSFTLPVAAFTDANPFATTADFTATIDWGDGTPNAIGTVTQPGGPGTQFIVTGSQNYVDPFVNGIPSAKFPISVTVKDVGGMQTSLANTANVTIDPIAVSGQLNPATDTGVSNTDAITKDPQPGFFGTTEPYANVQILAAPSGTSNFTSIGQVQANGGGAWNLPQSSLLADGRYTVMAKATNRSGLDSATSQILPNASQGPLTIDTVAPKVANVTLDRTNGQVIVTYQPSLVGMDTASIIDAANYRLLKRNLPFGSLLVTQLPILASATTVPGNAPDVTVDVVINNGRFLRGGIYTFIIKSGGVQDIAGNPLDGEFYGYFPSGNNVPGVDFVARLDSVHNRVLPPATVIGTASPVNPPGTLPGGFRIPTHNPDVASRRLARPAAIRPAMQVHSRTVIVTAPTSQPHAVHDRALHELGHHSRK